MHSTAELGEEKISKLLVKYSVPAITAMLTNALYSIIDRIFLGNSVGTLAIAGITVGFPILIMVMAFIMLIGIGGNSLVSIRLGAGKKEEAEQILANSLTLLVIMSVLISVLGLLFLEPLLKIFGASEAVLPYASDFLRIILLGSLFQAIGFGMNNFIRGDGNPKVAMATMMLGAILNIILCPIFIFGFGWGVKGSAWATVLSQAFSAGWVLQYFLTGKSNLKFHIKNLKLKKEIVLGIMSVGFAPFIFQFVQSIVSTIMNKSLVYYGGDVAVSGMGIVMSVIMLILMPIFGINQGVQPIIGYNFGAKRYSRVMEGFKIAALSATGIVTLGFLIIQTIPRNIIGLFSRDDQALVEFGVMALREFCIFLPVIGFQIVSSNYFQSVGKPTQSAILSLSRQVLFLIPVMLVLPKFINIKGVIYAGPISDILSAVLAAFLIFREFKKLRTQVLENSV